MDEPRNRRFGWKTKVVVAGLLALLYALSIGPVVYLVEYGIIPDSAEAAINTVYLPLGLVVWICPPLAELFGMYEDLFR